MTNPKREFVLKVSKTELTLLYESVLFYLEEAEVPSILENNIEPVLNKIIKLQRD
jgi:hypothetical protein